MHYSIITIITLFFFVCIHAAPLKNSLQNIDARKGALMAVGSVATLGIIAPIVAAFAPRKTQTHSTKSIHVQEYNREPEKRSSAHSLAYVEAEIAKLNEEEKKSLIEEAYISGQMEVIREQIEEAERNQAENRKRRAARDNEQDNAVGLKEEPLPSQTNGQANSGLDDVHEPSSSSGTGSLPVQSNDDGRADR